MKQRVLEEEQVTFSLLWYHYYSADLIVRCFGKAKKLGSNYTVSDATASDTFFGHD